MKQQSPMRIAREKRNLTQEELAKRVGITTAQISRIEAAGVPAIKTASRIVHQLGNAVTLDEVCRPERYMEISGDGALSATEAVA